MIRSIFLRALAFVALWWILAEGRLDGWLLGGVAVVAATWTSITLAACRGSCAYVLPG